MTPNEKLQRRTIQLEVNLSELFQSLSKHLLADKEKVVQELLANANDAIILRAARDPSFQLADGRITIGISTNPSTFSIADNGLGITPEELELAFATIASGGKRRELHKAAQRSSESVNDIIGSFGVGLLLPLIVSDKLEIVSCPIIDRRAFRATLNLGGHLAISKDVAKLDPGTTITLSLNDHGQFLTRRSAVEEIVLRFCRLVPVPVYFDKEEGPVWPGHRSRSISDEEIDLVAKVEQTLLREKLSYQAEPAIGGLRPDFIVYGPSGSNVILEVKHWNREPGYISRTLRQIDRYKAATGASAVLMVLPGDDREQSEEGIASLESLADSIRSEFAKPSLQADQKPISFQSQTVFAAMPFSGEYDDTYFVAMAPAAEKVGAACVRLDKEEFCGDIVSKIQSTIRESVAVIGDLSETKPNVMYEIGYAHALGKPVVHISSSPSDQLPFDVRNWNTIQYQKGRTHVLLEALVNRLSSII
jgi:hypothetical protein